MKRPPLPVLLGILIAAVLLAMAWILAGSNDMDCGSGAGPGLVTL